LSEVSRVVIWDGFWSEACDEICIFGLSSFFPDSLWTPGSFYSLWIPYSGLLVHSPKLLPLILMWERHKQILL
jgi:hypothetical protein